ncbi:hypothetical protein BUALT_Bualt02G0014700 [Buddleja alternifolia]|uniref:Mitochondrial carrier protein n=1 Tax=Buddleja alternifolia TaxID=168488 RepID=A0AAV6XX75_9LAMI|nr:hypothetical protein BUALT_Bualt02G0014700 [Buddleja alternifolia]
MKNSSEAEYLLKRNINTTYSNTLKPLLNGFLTGQYYALLRYCISFCDARLLQSLNNNNDPNRNNMLNFFKMANIQVLKKDLLCGATYTTASFGVFEILTNKLRATNNGKPLSLYQEACCGLVSGATAATVWQPLKLASLRNDPQSFSYRNVFGNLYHIVRNEGALALWKGSGLYMGTLMAANMGMLASYNRSLSYLMEKKRLHKSDAQLSASIISGFFYAAFSHPCIYVKVVKDYVQMKCGSPKKDAYMKIPRYISGILTPHSGFDFYTGFVHYFKRSVVFCVVQWWIFETIRSTDQEKRSG